ncbi:MAG TPA: hypothetical protein VFV33_16380 [Gemmatimonadaceae bacterium]|nr:hypothetical protein [Gemmatimonadaceae bacterium]
MSHPPPPEGPPTARQLTARQPTARHDRTIGDVRIEQGAHSLRITRSWARPAGWVMLLWTAVWFVMVGFLTSLGGHPQWVVRWWLSLPGVAMAYAAMTRFLNSTLIEVTATTVRVQHAPLPWPGRRTFARDDVRALHVQVKTIHARGGPVHECWIRVERANGKRAVLVKGLEMSAGQMSVIAAAMGDCLGVRVTSDDP